MMLFTSCSGDSSTNSNYDENEESDENNATTTYSITVVSTDSGNKFAIDGNISANLTLNVGSTYIFTNIPIGHPFRLSQTADGTHGGGSAIMDGVTMNGKLLTLTVSNSLGGSVLYYYCTLHSGMGGSGTITIVAN